MRKRIIAISFLIVGAGALYSMFAADVFGQAGPGTNITGALWGGSTFNGDTGCDGNNVDDVDCGALGWGSGSSDNTWDDDDNDPVYGLFVPPSTCQRAGCHVRGRVWFSNVGWLRFDYGGTDPEGGVGIVKRVNNELHGWARFENIAAANAAGNSGGWTGWVKMNGVAKDGNTWAPTISDNGDGTEQITGKAWSGEEILADGAISGLGWITFDLTVTPGSGGGGICGDGIPDPGEECGEPGLSCSQASDACLSCTCVSVPACGDGNSDPGEECGEPGLSCANPSDVCSSCICVPSGQAFGVTCSGVPDPTFLSSGTKGKVTWTANVSRVGNFNYTWAFTPNPVPPAERDKKEVKVTYDQTGVKNANVTVTDQNTGDTVTSPDCSVTVRWSKLRETIPF